MFSPHKNCKPKPFSNLNLPWRGCIQILPACHVTLIARVAPMLFLLEACAVKWPCGHLRNYFSPAGGARYEDLHPCIYMSSSPGTPPKPYTLHPKPYTLQQRRLRLAPEALLLQSGGQLVRAWAVQSQRLGDLMMLLGV